jgi:class 3 adenylate cyclase
VRSSSSEVLHELKAVTTVLFTDIVASTRGGQPTGRRHWRELLEVHDELARRVVQEFQGQLVKTTGDGILATFDGPGRGNSLRGRAVRDRIIPQLRDRPLSVVRVLRA